MRRFLAFVSVLSVAGCTSVSEPIHVQQEKFEIAATAYLQFPTWSDVINLAYVRASIHCESLGRKKMTVVRRELYGVRILTPLEARITYSCER